MHDHSPRTTRTSASERPSCHECGRLIPGRRRNGFCSDRCRMKARRACRKVRLHDLVEDMEQALAALKAELAGTRERTMSDPQPEARSRRARPQEWGA
jgi:hypothetical protein